MKNSFLHVLIVFLLLISSVVFFLYSPTFVSVQAFSNEKTELRMRAPPISTPATPEGPKQNPCSKGSIKQILKKPKVSDQILQKNYIDRLYQPTDTIPGGTSGAIREELLTGKPVGGHFHSEKEELYLKGLKNWLRDNPNANPSDRAIVNDLINDLEDALCR